MKKIFDKKMYVNNNITLQLYVMISVIRPISISDRKQILKKKLFIKRPFNHDMKGVDGD